MFQKLTENNRVGYMPIPEVESGFKEHGVDATATGWSFKRNTVSMKLEFSLQNLTLFVRPGGNQTRSPNRALIFTMDKIGGQEIGLVSTLSSDSF